MQYIRLGNSGLQVSRLCLGTMNMGTPDWKPWIFHEKQSEPIVAHALDNGVNFIDLADFYSAGVGEEAGRVERPSHEGSLGDHSRTSCRG